MRQGLLAAGLIAFAVALFTAGWMIWPGGLADTPLGDLAGLQAITTDVTALARSGDLTAAQVRIGDLETAWDEAEPQMRPMNPEAWGRVDAAADAALSALRAAAPDAAQVDAALVALSAALNDPGAVGATAGGILRIGTIAVTDGNGHPLPCEAMLADVAAARKAAPAPGAKDSAVADLVARAVERCNADDDQRSDAFSAAALQALASR